jgi:DNA adenine methylase
MRYKTLICWVGGKVRLIDEIDSRLPEYVRNGEPFCYVEPFVGGGAVLWHMLLNYNPKHIAINDSNVDLINFYNVFFFNFDALVEMLRTYASEYDNTQYKKEYYIAMRERFNACRKAGDCDALMRAAWFYTLVKTGYSCLWRVNSRGEFNVPFGGRDHIALDLDLFDKVYRRYMELRDSGMTLHIQNASYTAALSSVLLNAPRYIDGGQTFIYLDPPYFSNNGVFTKYTAGGFTQDDHKELREYMGMLNNAGIQYMLSNGAPEAFDVKAYYEDGRTYNVVEFVSLLHIVRKGHSVARNEILCRNYM